DQLAVSLLEDEGFRQQATAGSLLNQLALIVGSNPQVDAALRLLNAATSDEVPLALQEALLTSVDQGLRRRGTSVAELLLSDSPSEQLQVRMAAHFRRASELASDDQQSLGIRQSAVRLLALADWQTASKSLPALLSPQTPQSLQRAAVETLAAQSSEQVAATLLENWRVFSPQLRRNVVDALLTEAARINALVDAVENGTVRLSEIEADTRQLLLNHPDKVVRTRSEKVFRAQLNTDRAQVVQAYQDVLDFETDTHRGFEVFKQKCAVCHQVGEVGHAIAPNLASTTNKSSADLLIAILDPNREAQPNFNTYSVLTDDGRVISGIIAEESATSITLRRAEGKQDVILRSNIDELIANGTSLMPEGLEQDITRQQLADVISFLKSIGK
ncbi:MAG: c-type cytochrome, partial [Planctomycetales bacterium]|nr:c-type cytochrome [Planctomycetales bacterium]